MILSAMTDAGIVPASSETIQTRGGQTRTFSFANDVIARTGTSRWPGMRAVGCRRVFTSLARSPPSVALLPFRHQPPVNGSELSHGSASIRCVSTPQRGSLIQTSGIPPPRRCFARLSAAHHITSGVYYFISSDCRSEVL